ncbi:MAG: hypothetical protein R2862_11665 [Thermoanaerobaculia bacterium]
MASGIQGGPNSPSTIFVQAPISLFTEASDKEEDPVLATGRCSKKRVAWSGLPQLRPVRCDAAQGR